MSHNRLILGASAALLMAGACGDSYTSRSELETQQIDFYTELESGIEADGFEAVTINMDDINEYQKTGKATIKYGSCILDVVLAYSENYDGSLNTGSYTFRPYGSKDLRLVIENASQISEQVSGIECTTE
jgi:hypothetical protein